MHEAPRVVNAPLSRRLLFALVTSTTLERAVARVPIARAIAWRFARRYVAGTSVDDALTRVADLGGGGLAASVDMFGERVEDHRAADAVADAYRDLARTIAAAAPADTWPSLDLSHLAVATDPAGALRRLRAIVDALPADARLQIGAEEAALADLVVETVLALSRPQSVTATVQANLRRSAADAERLAAAGVPLRLVKGAYVESAAEAFPYGEPTDLAYLSLAHRLAELGADVSLATHDAVLREACLHALPNAPVEMLLGVREDDARRLAASGVQVRIYVPYGPNWFRYWMRRAAEARGSARSERTG